MGLPTIALTSLVDSSLFLPACKHTSTDGAMADREWALIELELTKKYKPDFSCSPCCGYIHRHIQDSTYSLSLGNLTRTLKHPFFWHTFFLSWNFPLVYLNATFSKLTTLAYPPFGTSQKLPILKKYNFIDFMKNSKTLHIGSSWDEKPKWAKLTDKVWVNKHITLCVMNLQIVFISSLFFRKYLN